MSAAHADSFLTCDIDTMSYIAIVAQGSKGNKKAPSHIQCGFGYWTDNFPGIFFVEDKKNVVRIDQCQKNIWSIAITLDNY